MPTSEQIITSLSLPSYMEYPIELHDNVPFISGTLDGQEVRFIFDSGGQDMLLNAHRTHSPKVGDAKGFRGINAEAKSFYTRIESLEFGAWKIQKVEAMAADLKHLEDDYGIEIHGIIGFRHLISFDWMVDYQEQVVHFWKRVRDGEMKIQHKINTRYLYHLPRLEVTIAGKPYQFLLDTGAPYLVMHDSHRDGLADELNELRKTDMMGGAGGTIETDSGLLSCFEIGPLKFEDKEVKFMDFSHMQRRFGPFDGIVGYSILEQVRTIVSWDQRALFFLED